MLMQIFTILVFSFDPHYIAERGGKDILRYPPINSHFYSKSTYIPIFSEDFETNTNWELNDIWAIGTPSYPDTVNPHGGQKVLGTVLDTIYPPNINMRTICNEDISLPQISDNENIWLWFYEWVELENYDYAYIEVYVDGHWETVQKYTGTSEGWKLRRVSLNKYAGKTIHLGFRLQSNDIWQYAGWYIDDITIMKETPDSVNFKIYGVDYSQFPYILLKMKVDSFGSPFEGIDESYFSIFENSYQATENIKYYPPGAGGFNKVDIVFMVDNSGSMSDNIDAVKYNIRDFVNRLLNLGIDYSLGLVIFGSIQNGGNPYAISHDLTSDVNTFISQVESMTSEGGFEPGWDAIVYAITHMNYRTGATKVLILMTDENVTDDGNQGTYTKEYARNLLLRNGFILFSLFDINEPHSYDDYGTLAEATGGKYFDINSPLGGILAMISSQIGYSYLSYKTPIPDTLYFSRRVKVEFRYNGKVYIDYITYNPADIIRIKPLSALDSVIKGIRSLSVGDTLWDFSAESKGGSIIHLGCYLRRDFDSDFVYISGVASGSDSTRWSVYLSPTFLDSAKYVDFYAMAETQYSTGWFPMRGGSDFVRLPLVPFISPNVFVLKKDTVIGNMATFPVIVYSKSEIDSIKMVAKRLGEYESMEFPLRVMRGSISELASLIKPFIDTTWDDWQVTDFIVDTLNKLFHHDIYFYDTISLAFFTLYITSDTMQTYLIRALAKTQEGFTGYAPSPDGWYKIVIMRHLPTLSMDFYKYAPVLIFEDNQYPMSVNEFLMRSKLLRANKCGPFAEIKEVLTANPTIENIRNYGENLANNEILYLSLKNTVFPGHTSAFTNLPVVVYGREKNSGTSRNLEYYLFYGINDYVDFHEGDWERIIIRFKNQDDTIPSEIWLSWHDFYIVKGWDAVEKVYETHPKVFVEKGSHAMYFRDKKFPDSIEVLLKRLDWHDVQLLMTNINKEFYDTYYSLEDVKSSVYLLGSSVPVGPAATYTLLNAFYGFLHFGGAYMGVADGILKTLLAYRTHIPESGIEVVPEGISGEKVYMLYPLPDSVVFRSDFPLRWGAPINKFAEMPEYEGYNVLTKDYVLVKYGERFLVGARGPLGPDRDVKILSEPYICEIYVPEGYKLLNPDVLERLGGVGYRNDTIVFYSQHEIDVELNFAVDDGYNADKPVRVSLIVPSKGILSRDYLLYDIDNKRRGMRLMIAGDEYGEPELYYNPRLDSLDVDLLAYPNPVERNNSTGVRIHFVCDASKDKVKINIYDEAAMLVKKLSVVELDYGIYEALWDLRNENGVPVSSGIYFYKGVCDKGVSGGVILVK